MTNLLYDLLYVALALGITFMLFGVLALNRIKPARMAVLVTLLLLFMWFTCSAHAQSAQKEHYGPCPGWYDAVNSEIDQALKSETAIHNSLISKALGTLSEHFAIKQIQAEPGWACTDDDKKEADELAQLLLDKHLAVTPEELKRRQLQAEKKQEQDAVDQLVRSFDALRALP